MILNNNYYTSSIDVLLQNSNDNTLFLSSWNKDETSFDFSNSIAERLSAESSHQISDYFFSDEFSTLKKKIISNNKELSSLGFDDSKMAIVSNGTSAIFLCLYELFKRHHANNALLVSPVYYNYINILKDFGSTIYFEMVDNISHTTLKQYNNNVDLIIINFPLFGCGENISQDKFEELINLSNTSGAYIVIDNLYGGMYWDTLIQLFDFTLLKKTIKAEKYIFIDSLTKKLYLNGAKHCVLFSDRDIISAVEKNSVYITGSISSSQYLFSKKLYMEENHCYVEQCLNNLISLAKQNYDLIKSLCMNTKCVVHDCNNGFFCLCGVPIICFQEPSKTISMALEILNHCNILTLPHDRYLFVSNYYYYFRVNLLLNAKTYYEAFYKLQSTFDLR